MLAEQCDQIVTFGNCLHVTPWGFKAASDTELADSFSPLFPHRKLIFRGGW
uniref:Uncharacterized protein n=1 Tax=Anguilla anguilla TaxID=7936 RepID=A0A0E9P956_ANGAN